MTRLQKKESLIVESNVLVHGKGLWTLSEMRLYLAMAAQVKREDKEFQWYDIYVQEFMEDADIKGKYLYKRLRETAEQLVEKKIVLKHEKTWAVYPFLAGAKYVEGQGYLQVSFHPDLKPFLLELQSNFTKYDLRTVLPLSSVYSIKIYRLLKASLYKGEVVYPVEELKELFGLESNYSSYFDFKRRIILKAQQEINTSTDIFFEVEEIKVGKGKKVTHLRFWIREQNPKGKREENLVEVPTVIEMGEPLPLANRLISDWPNVENRDLYNRMLSFGIAEKRVVKLITTHIEDQIVRNLDYVDKIGHRNGNIGDRAAYAVEAITQDFAGRETLEEREKREKHQADKERREALEKAKRKQEEQEDLYLKLLEQECHKLLQDPDFELDRVAEHFKKQTLDFFRTEIDRKQLKPSQYMRNLTIKGAFCRYLAEHYLDYYWHSFELWQDRKKSHG